MDTASVLYAEHLYELSELEARDRESIDEALAEQEMAGGQGVAVSSILKFYTIWLECSNKEIMPEGFALTDKTKNSYVIGSSPECDLILNDPSIDPLHCGVILEKGVVTVWDLGSNSGVRLNGNLITQEILKVGDIMTLGTLDLNVRFQLRRPNMNRPAMAPTAANAGKTMPMPKVGPQPKHLPKGAISYDKVSKQIKDENKPKPFLSKLGSLFGAKNRK
jgi:predicted component of type VI protein secretion system